ncbi:hypothetical protein T440DRAFT_464249 [Plenodomus tracheiphilus IPT5]|uniref:Uncharacterized protein n=1 Tax=Plenodomus tracheiphilus IPT5 TaxID=1408161 RepID=A0A6A7BHJ9_9PLEO|nr:hypothetical protein T440DRAFT_464249 [Plenodomus tracheiphilus IPT5]
MVEPGVDPAILVTDVTILGQETNLSPLAQILGDTLCTGTTTPAKIKRPTSL